MSNKVLDYYKDLYDKSGQVLEQALQANDDILVENHNYITDYENLYNSLREDSLEVSLFQNASVEYQFALFSVTLGQYRQAFMSLRLFFEMSLAAIQFSTNELELRLWLSGNRDIYWKSILDSEKGVFSKQFITAFWKDSINKGHVSRLQQTAGESYRECSEFVHGNFSSSELLPKQLKFDEEIYLKWQNTAQNMREIVVFCFCIRYLKDFSSETVGSINEIIIDEIGHITDIRNHLNS